MTELLQKLVGDHQAERKGLKEFLVTEIGTDKGEFSFVGRRSVERLVDIVAPLIEQKVPDLEVVVEKGAQVGVSTLAVGLATYMPSHLRKNVGYYLPTQDFADRFGATRFSVAIRRSPLLKSMMRQGSHKGADTKGLKEFGGRFLYSLGLESVVNAISIPLDALIYDEVDVIPQENMEWSDDRVMGSDWRCRIYFCVPMSPGGGIDRLYQESCQFRWTVTCRSCGKRHIPEEYFPDNVVRPAGTWQVVCPWCRSPVDVDSDADWIPEVPERVAEHRLGFKLSQLAVPAINLAAIMRRFEKSKSSRNRRAKFNCSTLAKPDAGDMQPITDAVLDRCQEPYRLALSKGNGFRFAGVDCGDLVHFACHELLEDGRKRWVWFEELDSDEAEARIEELWKQLGLSGLVIDSKPLRTLARAIAYAHPGAAWVQDFGTGAMRDEEVEHNGKKHLRVVVDRDDSLDEFTDLFNREPAQMVLPANDSESNPVLAVVRAHLKNLQKEKDTDSKGNTIFRYRRTVANHFGMAMNSSLVCERLAEGTLFGRQPVEYRTVDGRRFGNAEGAI